MQLFFAGSFLLACSIFVALADPDHGTNAALAAQQYGPICEGTLKLYNAPEEVARAFVKTENDWAPTKVFRKQNLTSIVYADNESGTCCWRICQRRRKCQVFKIGEKGTTVFGEVNRVVAYTGC